MTQNVNNQQAQTTNTQPQGNNQQEDRKYGALWFQKQPDGTFPILKVRVLHKDVGEFYQTSTHWVQFNKKNGGRGSIRVECNKKGTFGDVRDDIYCPLDAQEKYGAPNTRQWFWVQDMEDGGLKYVEMPYAIRSHLETLQMNYLQGKPLYNQVFQLVRTGQGLNTSYSVMPDPNHPMGEFDLQAFLGSLGLQQLPALLGDKDFPPIWSLTEDQMNDVAQGVMPWQKEQTAYDPRGGQPAQAQQAPAQAGGYPQQAVQQPTTQSTYQPQQAPQAPVQQPVQQQPVYQQPVQQSAPVLEPVQAAAPQPGLTPHTEHVPHVPYTAEGQQLDTEEEEFNELVTDDLPNEFY